MAEIFFKGQGEPFSDLTSKGALLEGIAEVEDDGARGARNAR